MMDEDEKANHATTTHTSSDNHKTSRRERFKGALARTKSKFKKHLDRSEESDDILSDDVQEFLSAGRTSTSSWTSGHESHASSNIPELGPISESANARTSQHEQFSRPSTADTDSFAVRPRQSPRRVPVPVPRIDVSKSQRWPAAQPIGILHERQEGKSAEYLRPATHTRSQSASSLAKRKGRGRGLSVTFIEAPPVIIGEGGDEALIPPVEISKARARARARSFSPVKSRSQSYQGPSSTDNPAASANKPHTQRGLPHRPDMPDILRPRGLRRVQTGAEPATTLSPLDKEFEMTLGLGNRGRAAAGQDNPPQATQILAPRPMRPVRPPQPMPEALDHSILRKEPARDDLQAQFREGDMLRLHLERDASSLADDNTSSTASSRRNTLEGHQPSQWI
ncbi:hypothetical protein ABEF95_000483 [Exophiala dermatitidis]